jgi:rare lipoprotein A
MRQLAAFVTVVLSLLSVTAPVGAAEPQPSLQAMRAERASLVRRIAAYTDDAVRAQRAAVAANRRVAEAHDAAEQVRMRVAAFAVDAFVDGVKVDELEQLRRKGWADIASKADQRMLAELESLQIVAEQQQREARAAVSRARRSTDRVRFFRAHLENLIADREAADQASTAARQAATASVRLPARPRYARTTRSQADLFARYPFGPTSGVPAGLVTTGQVVAGPASWYGPGFDGRPTASGAIFDQEAPTVASKELPLGTILLIHYGGRSVLALVNDRGPYVRGRVLDLSHGVASALGTVHAGVARVSAEIVVPG